jgi:hypothetical protein
MAYILEYTRTVDSNGNRLTIDENTKYERYGKMEYQSYQEADQDRVSYMWGSDNIYIRVKEVSNEN